MLSTEIKVRGYHCDAYGHVNNARYLEFLEEGRWCFLEPAMEQGVFLKRGLLFVIVNINISYKAPIVPDDLIKVNITDFVFKNMSMRVDQEIKKGEILCASAEVSFVLLDQKTQRPVQITEDLEMIFKDLLES